MRRLPLTLGIVVLGAVAVLQQSASARPEAARVIDRTYECSTAIQGGIREISAFARTGVRELQNSARWKFLAHTWLHSGSNFDAAFIGVGAGSPPPLDSSAGLFIETKLCRPTAARVPLTAEVLAGGPAPVLGETHACGVPATVLVRVRAVFRSPTTLRRLRFRQLGTGTPVRRAFLAARTTGGRQLVFAAVFESGKARLFTARSCVED